MLRRKYLSLMMGAILIISVAGAVTPGAASEGDDQKIVLVRDIRENEDVSAIEEVGDVIDRYGSYLLLEAPESGIEGMEEQYNIDWLENKNKLNVKGYEFDTNEGYPDIDPELMIDEYEKGEKGIYIVDMIGPVNPEWRQKLEEMGVDVINYQPNYAYEVVMMPEKTDDVEDLEFVDWVGIYQPGFKLSENLGTSNINIRLVENVNDDTISELESLIEVHSTTDLAVYGMQVIAGVDNVSVFPQIAEMREVYHIANHPSGIEFDSEIATQITGGGAWIWDPDENPNNPYRGHGQYGSLANQLNYTGKAVTIAVCDNGFWEENELDDFQDRVVGGAQYVDGEWKQDQWDIERHGSHVAGIAAGNTFGGTKKKVDGWLQDWYEEREDLEPPNNEIKIGDYYAAQGAAPDAKLYLQDYGRLPPTEESVEDFYSAPLNAVENSEAYIHTNSWFASGLEDQNEGKYLAPSEAYDKAVRDAGINKPLIIVSSAGNSGYTENGWQENTIGSPGTGKNEITVGATETYNPDLHVVEDGEAAEDYHVFNPYDGSNPTTILKVDYEIDSYRETVGSSIGWTNDNRIKPDVVAPGEGVLSTYKQNDEYRIMSGTSMSTPNVAGQAAVIVEWYEELFGEKPSPAMVKALLINTAEPLVYDGCSIPNKGFGWGIVNLADLVHPNALNFIVEDQNSLLETGDRDVYTIKPEDTSEPLKISLVWTDKEAKAGDTSTLNNDLNLEIRTPDGDIIQGNAFDQTGDGWSDDGYTYPEAEVMDDFDSNDNGWDNRNNVENIYLHPDEVNEGTYTIRVHGNNIVADSNNDGSNNQDYALVARNAENSDRYELSISVYGEGTTDPSPGTYLYSPGEEVSLDAWPTDPNWEFSHWDGDYYSESSSITIVMDDHKSLTAYFVSSGFDSYSVSSDSTKNENLNGIQRDGYMLESRVNTHSYPQINPGNNV